MISADRKGQNGFTLLELIITFAVGIILMMVAVPSYTTIVQNSTFSAELNALSSQIQLARAEALKRSALVILCPSADGGVSCNATASPWDHSASPSRVLFADENADGAIDAGELLRNEDNGSDRLTLIAVAPSPGPKSIRFDRKGLLDSKYTHFEFTDNHGASRCLKVSISGRVNITGGTCS